MLENLREQPNMICARGWRRLRIAVATGCRRGQANAPLAFPGNRLAERAELPCGVAISAAGAVGDAEPEQALPARSKAPLSKPSVPRDARPWGPLPESQSSPLHRAPGGLYCVYARVLNILSLLDWHVNNFTSEQMAPFWTPDSRLVVPLATHAGRRAEWP
jgi:hypothetical protein